MKGMKREFVFVIIGVLLVGCKGKEARAQKQLGLGSK